MKKNILYHLISASEALKEMNSERDGLSVAEAEKRLKLWGRNELPSGKKLSHFHLFVRQFNSPLIYLILVATFLSFLIGHMLDAIFIIIVIFVNTIVGFLQEAKAEKALEKLSKSVKFFCRVIRDGKMRQISSEDVVAGDIIELREGDKVPADGRLLECRGLKINEAALTGEWAAVAKSDEVLAEESGVSDQKNMVFMGTIVEEGKGVFLVTAISGDTQIGKIAKLVNQAHETQTPIQKKFKQLSRILGGGILAVIAIFSLINIFRGEDWYVVFTTAIALVVSAVPEGLLPAITVILVLGMRRLARHKALVRKLNATEGMGAVSVICMDKTGTLTKGEMQVSHILSGTRELLYKGKAFENENNIQAHIKTLETALLIQDAYAENPDDDLSDLVVRGNLTARAIFLAGISAGITKESLQEKMKLRFLESIDFSSEKKYSANVYEKEDGRILVCVMGAPEKVIDFSSEVDVDGKSFHISSDDSKKLFLRVDNLASKGLRILACAFGEFSREEYEGCKGNLDKLKLVGFLAFKDPLRKEVAVSIADAKRAGIRPIIITGDHKNTAKAIMSELGMEVGDDEIMEGKNLDNFSDLELERIVEKVSIFARVIPEHKIRIVKALQRKGEVVAMVGDGVNDAPALKAADIGISVGSGTDIAKEVSDIVLTDSSFSVIIKAIEQGRLIKENIRRIVVYLLADDFSELFLFFGAVALGMPFPLYPVQILWINLVEDSFPDIALTTEKDTAGLMDQKPAAAGDPLLNSKYKKFMLAVFLVSGIAAFSVFYFTWKILGDLDRARTITFALVAFDSLVFAFIVRSFRQSFFSRHIFSNKILDGAIFISLVLLLIGLYFPPMQKILNVVSLSIFGWVIILGVSLAELVILEFFKKKLLRNNA